MIKPEEIKVLAKDERNGTRRYRATLLLNADKKVDVWQASQGVGDVMADTELRLRKQLWHILYGDVHQELAQLRADIEYYLQGRPCEDIKDRLTDLVSRLHGPR